MVKFFSRISCPMASYDCTSTVLPNFFFCLDKNFTEPSYVHMSTPCVNFCSTLTFVREPLGRMAMRGRTMTGTWREEAEEEEEGTEVRGASS